MKRKEIEYLLDVMHRTIKTASKEEIKLMKSILADALSKPVEDEKTGLGWVMYRRFASNCGVVKSYLTKGGKWSMSVCEAMVYDIKPNEMSVKLMSHTHSAGVHIEELK